jgi:hypothetical protein
MATLGRATGYTGKSLVVIAPGHAAADAGFTERYAAAAELVGSLYGAGRYLGRQSGRVDICRPTPSSSVKSALPRSTAPGPQLLFRFVAAANQRGAVATAGHWRFEEWGGFLPNETAAVSVLDRLLHHSIVVVTDAELFRMREARQRIQRPKAFVTTHGTRKG